MSKEAIRGSGVGFALMNGDAIEVILLRFWRCMNIPEHLKRNQFMRFLHSADTYDIICVAISYIFVRCRSMWKNPPPWIVLRMSTSVVGGLWGLAMPSNLAPGPLTCLEVCCQVQTNDTRLRNVTPFTEGAAADTCRGGMAASGRHEGGPLVCWAQTLFWNVPMGWPITTRWESTLAKGRPVKVKGLDLRVNRARIRSVGGLGGINGTQTCIVS